MFVVSLGDGDDLEDDGDILGKMLCPGEKSDEELLSRETGGWNAEDEGKDFKIGVSPLIENIGLKRKLSIKLNVK